jgi:pantoate--beta-alanine ligase
MKIIKTINELQQYRQTISSSVGFVPTMGALHDGHISLIKHSLEQNNITIVSIFVNPTQFLANEDLDKYPRKDQADIKICELLGVDILFMPDINTIYTTDEVTIKAPKLKGYILEGYNRAGHFDGVLQIVLKLFNLTKPTKAYFGKKDAQQLALINQMVKDFYIDIDICECEIIREESGLALSSRNVYLTKQQKKDALKISASLKVATNMIQSGIFDTKQIIKEMEKTMDTIDIQYIAILSRDLTPIQTLEIKNSIILVAAKIADTRLIDNIWI